jgi:hypothetical protein
VTPGERLVWASVYAASWTAQCERVRKYGGERSDELIAAAAAGQAHRAVAALREVYRPAEMPLDCSEAA